MRVLFLTNIPTQYRVDFFNELGKYCKLTVLYERQKASDRDESWEYSNAINYEAIFLKGNNIGIDGAICLDVIKWLKKDRYDVIVVGGYSTPTGMLAIQTMKIKKIPFVLNSDGGFIKKDRKLVYLLKKYFISSASWWLSTGKSTNEYLRYYGASNDNIFIYPFTSIKKDEIAKKLLNKEEKKYIRNKINILNKKTVVSVGRFIYSKGYDILIDIWKDIDKDVELLIIGSGEEKYNLEKMIQDSGLNNVKLIEFKQKKELIEYYKAADVFILPTRGDVWGLVINEAMSQGLPIITTYKCIAGIELIDNDYNGKIVNLNNRDSIINSINNLLNNEDKIRSISNNNILKIQKYTIEEMVKTHMEIFSKIKVLK